MTAPVLQAYRLDPEVAALLEANPELVIAMQANPRRDARALGLHDGGKLDVMTWNMLTIFRFSLDAAALGEVCRVLRLLRPEETALIDELDAARTHAVTTLHVRRARRVAALLHYVSTAEIRQSIAATGDNPKPVASTITQLRKHLSLCAVAGDALRLELAS